MCQLGCLHESLLRGILIEQITFEIGYLSISDRFGVNIFWTQHNADAEEGLHCPIGIGGHKNQTARRGLALVCGPGPVIDACGLDVMAEDAAKLVVAHFTNIGAYTA